MSTIKVEEMLKLRTPEPKSSQIDNKSCQIESKYECVLAVAREQPRMKAKTTKKLIVTHSADVRALETFVISSPPSSEVETDVEYKILIWNSAVNKTINSKE